MSATEYWEDYERRVTALEEQGCTRSDAQGIVDVENYKQHGKWDWELEFPLAETTVKP